MGDSSTSSPSGWRRWRDKTVRRNKSGRMWRHGDSSSKAAPGKGQSVAEWKAWRDKYAKPAPRAKGWRMT